MKLPNANRAVVEERKVLTYLLNAAHPDNGGKAAFFLSLGFTRSNWEHLAAALRKLAVEGDVSNHVVSAHGTKYVLEGRIHGPEGKTGAVRTIWIVEPGLPVPRLVTAYPYE